MSQEFYHVGLTIGCVMPLSQAMSICALRLETGVAVEGRVGRNESEV